MVNTFKKTAMVYALFIIVYLIIISVQFIRFSFWIVNLLFLIRKFSLVIVSFLQCSSHSLYLWLVSTEAVAVFVRWLPSKFRAQQQSNQNAIVLQLAFWPHSDTPHTDTNTNTYGRRVAVAATVNCEKLNMHRHAQMCVRSWRNLVSISNVFPLPGIRRHRTFSVDMPKNS